MVIGLSVSMNPNKEVSIMIKLSISSIPKDKLYAILYLMFVNLCCKFTQVAESDTKSNFYDGIFINFIY